MKRTFIILSVIGVVIISILSFTLPSDPYMDIPALTVVSFDKPLWFCIMVGGSFIYLLILYSIYDKLKEKNARN